MTRFYSRSSAPQRMRTGNIGRGGTGSAPLPPTNASAFMTRVQKPKKIPIYDGFIFVNSPDLRPYGIQDMNIFYEGAFSGGENEAVIRSLANAAAGFSSDGPVQIDFESWQTDNRPGAGVGDAVADANIEKFRQMLTWWKDEEPGHGSQGLSVYSVPPIRDYWPPVQFPDEMPAWMAANDNHAPMTNAMSSIMPSLYTFYEDQAGWVKYAKGNIQEARRIAPGKPVYPILWMQYHDTAPAPRTYLPENFWRIQLQTCLDVHVDGIILWGGFEEGTAIYEQWSVASTLPWWQVTKDFIRSL